MADNQTAVAPDAPAAAAPQPILDAEKTLTDAVPVAVKPAVQSVEDQFNTVLEEASGKSPEAEAQAAKVDPAIEELFHDALPHGVLSGGGLITARPAAVSETRRGYKTTEFWLALVVIVLAQLGALSLPGHYGKTITTAAAALSYILSRGIAKAGVHPAQ